LLRAGLLCAGADLLRAGAHLLCTGTDLLRSGAHLLRPRADLLCRAGLLRFVRFVLPPPVPSDPRPGRLASQPLPSGLQ
jgi:hypothetical protein